MILRVFYRLSHVCDVDLDFFVLPAEDILQDEQGHPFETLQQVQGVPLADLLPLGIFHPPADRHLELLLHHVDEPSVLDQLLGLARDLEGSAHLLASVDEGLRPFVCGVSGPNRTIVGGELDIHLHRLYVCS